MDLLSGTRRGRLRHWGGMNLVIQAPAPRGESPAVGNWQVILWLAARGNVNNVKNLVNR